MGRQPVDVSGLASHVNLGGCHRNNLWKLLFMFKFPGVPLSLASFFRLDPIFHSIVTRHLALNSEIATSNKFALKTMAPRILRPFFDH